MSELPAPSSLYAISLLGALIQHGVRDIVVCPGSRSQALALAAAEAERAGAVRLHVRTDERSAAFFALGLALETGAPAPVIVTSGSAVANLLPAALEAHESRVPQLLLTADRPAEMRGTRSNQTTRQSGLFADITRLALDIDVDEAVAAHASAPSVHDPAAVAARAMNASFGIFGGEPAGPVQLNLQFREPLSGWPTDFKVDLDADELSLDEFFARAAERRERRAAHEPDASVSEPDAPEPARPAAKHQSGAVLEDHSLHDTDAEAYVLDDDALTVVIAGEGAGVRAEAFAREAGLPLLAEVVSGSRYGREAITAYATLIDDPEVGALVERAIVFGHPTLTRQVPALLKRDDVEVIVVDPHDGAGVDHFDPSGSAQVVRSTRVADLYNPQGMRRWLGAWVVADRALREQRSTVHEPDLEAARSSGYKERNAYARHELAVMREPVSRELLVESVWRATWPHDRLVLAASRLVRVLDQLAAPRRVEVRANRGLSGIDGTVATALGVAIASQVGGNSNATAGVTRVLVGDLALLHDVGSMLIPEAEIRPRIQMFVGNDGGGTIFDTLEAADSAPKQAFDRVMYTPQRADFAALAEAYGWSYRRVETRAELERLLTEPVTGTELIEVPLQR